MAYYIGILEGRGRTWSIRVPDLPGCHGGGTSVEAAAADTISAMREWAVTVISRGQPVPPPRTAEAVMADADVAFDAAAGESLMVLPLLVETGKPVKANVSIDAGVLAAIDAEAGRRGMTRSAFRVAAARDMIERAAA